MCAIVCVRSRVCYQCLLTSLTSAFCDSVGIWHCYLEFSLLRQQPRADVTIVDIGFQTDVMVYLQLSQTWLIFCESSPLS